MLAVKVATSAGHLNNGGSITLTTGVVAQKPMPNWTVPAAYAAGLYGLTRNLALDLSSRNIRVNGVSPGPVETELWSAIPEEQRRGFLDQMGSKLLTGKLGAAEDVANVYVYLLKDRNATGQVVVTDGGSTVADRA